ncbi:translation machinery-associated protein [Aspergillus heteromorphus CBS 117.55]|uniref:Translation machinery-associated protein n=1 Tax=Aspergillus heteromorphus CBS 117.55 TaxID=1448321 RepID=A0A317X271_9EURO|nr:translation machinery-associated protein [Aspergillus heteromorphus CBS 117.55]PWY92653.1 translation machinery-associated protein [Aspergillus heteromorphus CBS 117.55]
MPIKALSKVHKHIAKKRGAVQALHEFSRDARRLRKANARDDRITRVSANMSRGRQTYVDRISYFYEAIPEDAGAMSEDEMKDLVIRYINRSVPEIEQLQSERRKGRPPSKREEALLQRTDVENKEFKTGFWMPDFSEVDVVRALAAWNGDWSGLSTMKFIRITKEGGKQVSAFPPKGMS